LLIDQPAFKRLIGMDQCNVNVFVEVALCGKKKSLINNILACGNRYPAPPAGAGALVDG